MDVMGGIADYSGSLVLQMPISEACFVALQLHKDQPGITSREHVLCGIAVRCVPEPPRLRGVCRADAQVRVVSLGHTEHGGRAASYAGPTSALFPSGGEPLPYAQACRLFKARQWLLTGATCGDAQHTCWSPRGLAPRSLLSTAQADAATSWAAYVLGCLLVLAREKGAPALATSGLSVLVSSHVPEGG